MRDTRKNANGLAKVPDRAADGLRRGAVAAATGYCRSDYGDRRAKLQSSRHRSRLLLGRPAQHRRLRAAQAGRAGRRRFRAGLCGTLDGRQFKFRILKIHRAEIDAEIRGLWCETSDIPRVTPPPNGRTEMPGSMPADGQIHAGRKQRRSGSAEWRVALFTAAITVTATIIQGRMDTSCRDAKKNGRVRPVVPGRSALALHQQICLGHD
jgi:hypothetical protein